MRTKFRAVRVRIVVLTLTAVVAAACCGDRIIVFDAAENTSVGVMYDGASDTGEPIRARVLRSDSGVFRLPDIHPRDKDPVTAFGVGRAPVYTSAKWQDRTDVETVVLIPAVTLQVKIHPVAPLNWGDWIHPDGSLTPAADLEGMDPAPTEGWTLRSIIENNVAMTNSVFFCERFGVKIEADYEDQVAPGPLASGGGQMARQLAETRSVDTAINVYIVESLNSSAKAGYSAKSLLVEMPGPDGDTVKQRVQVILLGYLGAELLIGHEVGHHLGLLHNDGCPGFDAEAQSNFMDSNSGAKRKFVTEGQTIRAHFGSYSLFHSQVTDKFRLRSDVIHSGFDPKKGGYDAVYGDYPPHCWRVWKDDEPANDSANATHVCELDADHDCPDTTDYADQAVAEIVANYMRQDCLAYDPPDLDAALRDAYVGNPDDRAQMRDELTLIAKQGFIRDELKEMQKLGRKMYRIRAKFLASRPPSAIASSLDPVPPWGEDEFVKAFLARERGARRARARQGLAVINSDD